MNIEINENVASGIIQYCNRNSLDFNKVVEESIIQTQLRHNIGNDGTVYENIPQPELDKAILETFLKDILHEKEGNIKEALFGEIYEKSSIENHTYIIVEYENKYTIVVVTTDEKIRNLITGNPALSKVRVEKHQAYSWITTYHTKVLCAETGNSNIILSKNL
ncbi:MAG: hypothetical protein LBU80_00490 [Rikenellaceae bacterium]|nr:hypothetical protein [Rikenellaceae bacterium]